MAELVNEELRELKELLITEAENTSDWRARKAEDYPTDLVTSKVQRRSRKWPRDWRRFPRPTRSSKRFGAFGTWIMKTRNLLTLNGLRPNAGTSVDTDSICLRTAIRRSSWLDSKRSW